MHGYAQNKDDYLKRLRRIEGQIRGLQLEEHLGHCVAGAIAEGGDAATDKVREASDAIACLVRS